MAVIVFMEHAVAVQAADAVHKFIEPAVIQPADDHAHGMAHQGVIKAGELPRAQVAGQDQHPFAPGLRSKVVVQTLGANPAASIFSGIAGHAAELHQLPAQMNVDPAQDIFSGFG